MKKKTATTLQTAQKYYSNGDSAKAEALCVQALKGEPKSPEVLQLSGIIALNNGNFDRAIQAFKKVVSLRRNNAGDYYNLGLAYINAGMTDLSIHSFKKSIELQPGLAVVYGDLCLALTQSNNIKAAISAGKKAVLLSPDSPVANYNLALAYDAWKNYEGAFGHYQKAAELLPGHPGIQVGLAKSYVSLGDTKAAATCFRNVIKLYPKDVESYRQLARINKFTSPDHEDVGRLKAIVTEAWLSDEDRASVFFALGKIYQDCELYDKAFFYYQQGNQLQESISRFIPEEFADYISAIIEVSSSKVLAEKSKLGNTSKTPVFIIGAPRSGTSLVEQILSSHPDVYGAGELDWFVNTASSMQEKLGVTLSYPQCITELNKSNIDSLAYSYLSYLRSLAGDALVVIDKMPGNFLYLNIIHIFFPNARIIHCRRDPKDTCVSMYTEYFPDAVPYSYNLINLGAYYKQYERIMDHWHSVIPECSMMNVDYENLVQNQEEVSRQLVEFVGLQWDNSCLSFYKKKRWVNTASDLVVKKPIYSSSIGRWKKYQKYLQPLEQGFKYWD